MRKFLHSIVYLLLFTELQAQLIEVQNFSELTEFVDKETLIVLDIDDTLLIPCQMLGCDEWFLARMKNRKAEGIEIDEALDLTLAEWEAIRHLTQMEVVEKDTEKLVRQLQDEGYSIMGLTTQGLALATRTSQQLKINGFNLKTTAPIKSDHYLMNANHGVLFRNGILFTSGSPKGEALYKLLDDYGLKFPKIVFINDKASHLREIESSSEARGVNFIGLRYAFSDQRKASFRYDVADIQFKKSSFEKILSDQEAMELLMAN